METYTAVVETGSCSIDGKRWETKAKCGHAHKTRDAAERCGIAHRAYDPKTRNCSALWAYPRIHNQNGERV